jgi:hypothetical protein
VSNGAWIVVGAAVGAVVALVGGFVERASHDRGDLVSAAAAWLAATEALAMFAQMDATFSTPSTNVVGRLLDRMTDVLVETIGTGRVELLRALIHRPLIRRVELVTDRVLETTMLLVLEAPAPMLREIQPHLQTLDAWLKAPGDATLREKWEENARPSVVNSLRRWTRPFWWRLFRIA